MESAISSPLATSLDSNQSKFSKRPFLLLEVLISILIVSLCLIPFIHGPISTYRDEMKLLEEMERERLAEYSFIEVKEKLLSREIPWEKIPGKGETSFVFHLTPKFLEIPETKRKKIERSFTLRCTGEKEGEKGEVYKMLKVDLLFSPPLKKEKKHTCKFMVQKLRSPALSAS